MGGNFTTIPQSISKRFRKKPDTGIFPIHFFTIVLNGEPFIRYHERMLADLTVPWHWHVVEGVAALKHDTAWSVAQGGRVPDEFHRQGRSVDGTSEYIDEVARRWPDRVTIYRKPVGEFWDGKREMVNAPLRAIMEPCLLWEIDSDELWTSKQVMAVYRAFRDNPKRTAARFWCRYFVGPDKIVSTRNTYGQYATEWLRAWRYRPGYFWARHEPPVLARRRIFPRGIEAVAPFTQDEMESIGAVFQHFAYATEAQLAFKEKYYGYADAVKMWRKLQQTKGAGLLRDYLKWVPDDAKFDDARNLDIKPLAIRNPDTGNWSFPDKPSNASPSIITIVQTDATKPGALPAYSPARILSPLIKALRFAASVPGRAATPATPTGKAPKLYLPDVTLVMIETRRHRLARMAIEDCLRHAEFGEVVICSDRFDELRFSGAAYVQIADFDSKLGVNEYLWYGLPALIKTPQALLIQWDSWIIDPAMWRDKFLSFDYIGAPWPWHKDGLNVGNSGFSLRSKRLMDFLVENRDRFPFTNHSEDDMLSRIYRRALEKEGNFLWAPERDAFDFAFEHIAVPKRHFGFHAAFNWPHVLDRDRLIERVEIAERDDYIRNSGKLDEIYNTAPWLKDRSRSRSPASVLLTE